MDLYTSCSPLLDEFELVRGIEGVGSYYYKQRTRSRKSSPSSYEEEGVGGGAAATTLSLKMPTSASSVEPAVLPIAFFSSPPPLPFMATIATSAAAFGCNETTTTMHVDKTLEDDETN